MGRVLKLRQAIEFARFQIKDGQDDCVFYNLGKALEEDALYKAAPVPAVEAGWRAADILDCATWVPLDENGAAEVRVNGQRITSMPSYAGAEEVAERINKALVITSEMRAAPSAPGEPLPEEGLRTRLNPDDEKHINALAEAMFDHEPRNREKRWAEAASDTRYRYADKASWCLNQARAALGDGK